MAEENKNQATPKEIMVRLSAAAGGEWGKIYAAVKERNPDLPPAVTPERLNGWTPVSLLDPEYPEILRKSNRPPFVLFCKGDVGLLAKKPLLLICQTRKGDGVHCSIGAMIRHNLAGDKVPAIIDWRPRACDDESQLQSVLEAYEVHGAHGLGIDDLASPLIVFLPASAADPEKIAERVVRMGGLAIRESFPGSERRIDPMGSRIPAALCGAVLVLGGEQGSKATMLMALAANAGKEMAAIPYEYGDPDGYLCNFAIDAGARLIGDAKKLREFADEVAERAAAEDAAARAAEEGE